MKHNYTKLIGIALMWILACMTAQAKDKTTAYEADIYLANGTVKHSDNFIIPRGCAAISFTYKAQDVVVVEPNNEGKLEEVTMESDAVDYFISWNKSNPEAKHIFRKIYITKSGKQRGWATLEKAGEKGMVYGLAPVYYIEPSGLLILQGEQNRPPLTYFIFEGDEYATQVRYFNGGWEMWTRKWAAKSIFKGDEKMIKEVTSGKYKPEDLQYVLDNYKRPTPLKLDK